MKDTTPFMHKHTKKLESGNKKSQQENLMEIPQDYKKG